MTAVIIMMMRTAMRIMMAVITVLVGEPIQAADKQTMLYKVTA